jgi:hypothetical protein
LHEVLEDEAAINQEKIVERACQLGNLEHSK